MLALFAEGIAGRPYHIRPLGELDDAELPFGQADPAGQDGHSVYLPERPPEIAENLGEPMPNAPAYRLLALDQLGLREFGTFSFDFATAERRIPDLAGRAAGAGHRESDYRTFFRCFSAPAVARRLFRIIETARVRAAVDRRYPGARRIRAGRRTTPAPAAEDAGDQLALLQAALEGGGIASPLQPLAAPALAPGADVYGSAAATVACFDALSPAPERERSPGDGDVLEWLQRQARLEEWEEELARLEDQAAAALQFGERSGEDRDAAAGEGGSPREIDADLAARRDEARRRIDMERASVRHALGESRDGAVSFRYDEWDYERGRYLRAWCRLFEAPLIAEANADSQALLDAARPFAPAVRRRFADIRPAGARRVKKTPEGDELDLEAIVQARADLRSGTVPDERVYSRRERRRRDVAAALLVDLSASTDDIVPEERESEQERRLQDIRDPFFDDDEDFAARLAADAAKRRIIDIQREAVLLLATALEGLGDRYGVYGFSGYGRDGVEFWVAKEFDAPLDQAALDAIAAMKPERSTRMGPAIRHGAAKLDASGAALKVLMIVSDGYPQDHDYGPRRGDREYGVQDTAKALEEAQALGIETFCVTVDRSGHDYLRRMCPQQRYMVIEETRELPDALQKAYRRLTRR